MIYASALPSYDLYNKRVILRADLNVPLNNGIIIDDYRLHATLPSIDLILNKKGTITLLTHIGRPKNHDATLSTKLLVPWFTQRGYSITWAADIDEAQRLSNTAKNTIILLENLRFYPEEKSRTMQFAQKLSLLGDFYVNDAFGALHRDDTSITLLPQFFPLDRRTIGLLVEKELATLSKLVHKPRKPFIMILGGGKVKDKIPMMENLLTHVQAIVLCPALAATFLKAQGKEVGKSLVDDLALPFCTTIMEKAHAQGVELLFPLDYLIARDTMAGQLEIVDAHNFPINGIALSIGPKTIERYTSAIKSANTIFYNAAMGLWNIPKSLEGTAQLLQAIACTTAFSVVGGGDSVAAAHRLGLSNSIDFLSTGGGATLTYLSGRELPGLQALSSKKA